MIGSHYECLYSQNFRKRLLDFIRNKPLILKELEEIIFSKNQELIDNCLERIESYKNISKDTDEEINQKIQERLTSYLELEPFEFNSETIFNLIVWKGFLSYLSEFKNIYLTDKDGKFHLGSQKYQPENILKILDNTKEDDGKGYKEAVRLIVNQYLLGKNSEEEILEIFYQLVVKKVKTEVLSIPTSNLFCYLGQYLRRDKMVGLIPTPKLEQLQSEIVSLSPFEFSFNNSCTKDSAEEFLERELKKRKKEEY